MVGNRGTQLFETMLAAGFASLVRATGWLDGIGPLPRQLLCTSLFALLTGFFYQVGRLVFQKVFRKTAQGD